MMKETNGKGNVPERDTWQTPQWLFDELDKQYEFIYDCCADSNNSKVGITHPKFEEVPIMPNDVMCWMNPPFSKAAEMFEHFFKVVKRGVAIYRCDNLETALWQDLILKSAAWILIPKGRYSYEGMPGKGSRFPSALIGYNVAPPKYVEGTILRLT